MGPNGFDESEKDPMRWDSWWEFNKDPFLNLRSLVHSLGTTTKGGGFRLGDGEYDMRTAVLAPTRDQLRGEIEPALRAALGRETNNDIVTGCLIALAKLGEYRDASGRLVNDPSSGALIASFLSDPNQEIRETAAIALGILGDDSPQSLERLLALLDGSFEEDLGLRSRAFAAYGIGLLGANATDPSLRARIAEALAAALLPAEREATQDLATAVVISLGLVHLPSESVDPRGRSLEERLDRSAEDVLDEGVDSLEDQIAFLTAVFEDRRLDRILRSHVPTALGRLLRSMSDDPSVDGHRRAVKWHVASLLLPALDPKRASGLEEVIQQSCALALGLVGDADGDPLDRRIRDRLIDAHRRQQRQARSYALIALAKIAAREGETTLLPDAAARLAGVPLAEVEAYRFADGREDVAEHLERRMQRARSGEEYYAGLGAGILGWELHRAGGSMPPDLGRALVAELDDTRSSDGIAAFSIASGLGRQADSLGRMRELLLVCKEPTARGYVALGLGLLGDRRAIDDIEAVVSSSTYRPELLKQAAIAMGLLGEKETVADLIEMLRTSNSLAAQAAIATALGFIGDRTAVAPLIEMLEDESRTALARAFAAAALGIVGDRSPLPWNSMIGVDLNYRASVPTLVSPDGKGVLNLL